MTGFQTTDSPSNRPQMHLLFSALYMGLVAPEEDPQRSQTGGDGAGTVRSERWELL